MARTGTITRSSRRGARRKARAPGLSSRAKVVWLSLLASMTGVGSLLMLTDRSPATAAAGRSMPLLLATVGGDWVREIFQTRVPLKRDAWTTIVIHDTGAQFGTPQSLDAEARRNGLRGLGYHFLIGNGDGMGDGELFVGSRWMDQLPGAHTAGGDDTRYFNLHGIGVALIGDGERAGPSEDQFARLVRLVRALQEQLGIPADRVVLHSQITGVRSPGRLFPTARFREQLIPNP